MGKLRAAIVGTGFMGAVHARSATVAGAQVVAVVGSSPEKGRRAAAAFGVGEGCDSLEDALRQGVDVVHVCTPNATHERFATAAIKAGVAVVCEKPLATDKATAERLADLAAQAGVVTSVPFVYRYYAAVREARARIGAPGHRPPWLIHGSYLQDWLADPAATNWRVDPVAGGATRAFGDIGVHWCDLAEFVTGQRITRVLASFARAVAKRPASGTGELQPVETEDGAVVMFETDAGALGSVVVSQATAGRKNALSFSFDGPAATYAFCQETPESLWIGGRDGNRILLRDPDRSGSPVGRAATLPAGHPQGYYECFADFVAETYAAIRGEDVAGLPTFADGLRAADVTDSVVTSAKTGSWVEIPSR
ncbi:Gfo/Idh/MocA family oxidoreductase [Amycolatopsis bartoniae]|uniref:Dehydrogenase n=1 Tax=Amycolatopsis bartoniae TaxID=941986 RepID=A0A8H9IS41_9PSEU|nr:Gfo/Idh/MocA family oxidoreductase [Amycolatopsis bartoniae]TVT10207.1 Gfo/Idh/MocA family oxidoreductase [Amycolatopsis bartoniae]GHF34856.1 dehydrogenase [Amycolatopsis bartoniae]